MSSKSPCRDERKMTLPDVIYWDCFAEDYCLNKDEFAPPERYMITTPTMEGTYIERWAVSENKNGNRLSIAFTEDLYKGDPLLLAKARRFQFKRNECEPIQLIGFSIPRSLFEKYCLELMGWKKE